MQNFIKGRAGGGGGGGVTESAGGGCSPSCAYPGEARKQENTIDQLNV